MTTTRKFYALHEVLETAGISLSTLRVYEELGFVPTGEAESDSSVYPEEALETILRVQRLRRELGVNLAGIEVILEMRRKIELLQHELDEVVGFMRTDLRTELETLLQRQVEAPGKASPRPRRTFRG